jgi:hypothetical protein
MPNMYFSVLIFVLSTNAVPEVRVLEILILWSHISPVVHNLLPVMQMFLFLLPSLWNDAFLTA